MLTGSLSQCYNYFVYSVRGLVMHYTIPIVCSNEKAETVKKLLCIRRKTTLFLHGREF